MPTRRYEIALPASRDAVWAFHESEHALAYLTPPNQKLVFQTDDLTLRLGGVQKFTVSQFGIRLVWVAEITVYEPPKLFIDRALQSPFEAWEHEHEFTEIGPNRTLLRDTVTYTPPLGPLGELADILFIGRQVNNLFAFRHAQTLKYLTQSNPT